MRVPAGQRELNNLGGWMNTSLLTTDTPGKGVVRGAELVFVNLAPSAGQTGQRMVSRSSEPGSGTRAAAFAIRVLSANDGFRFQPMAALGTQLHVTIAFLRNRLRLFVLVGHPVHSFKPILEQPKALRHPGQ